MSVEYLNVAGITEASKLFKSKIEVYDNCVTEMKQETNTITNDWVGEGSNQFQTQILLMMKQLDDISDVLYDIYQALLDAEVAYIDQDVEVAKQISINSEG